MSERTDIHRIVLESISMYGREFANELLVKAQLEAMEHGETVSLDHVKIAYSKTRQAWKQPLWKTAVFSVGNILLGAVVNELIHPPSEGFTVYLIMMGIVGAIMFGYGLPRQ